jgi:hypothetical protein
MHKCSNKTCLNAEKVCTKGFPKPILRQTQVDPVTGRWEYPRLSKADDYVVNYHPGLLRILGVHVHLQRVTGNAWQDYMMKYLMRVDTHGEVNMTASVAHAFGLPEEVSVGTLQACAAMFPPMFPPCSRPRQRGSVGAGGPPPGGAVSRTGF